MAIWTPNAPTTSHNRTVILAGWAGLWLVFWAVWRPAVLPSPFDVLEAFPALWLQDGLGQEMITSFMVNLQALVISTAIALPLSYLSVVPVFRPAAVAVTKLRFLSPGLFFMLLLFALAGGHAVKVAMLVLALTFFLTTTMVTVIGNIPSSAYDDARTLRMGEWKCLWYVVVRRTLPDAFEAVRDNAAMSLSMLVMVEGIVRSEGGVGLLIINQERHFEFSAVYAVALAILAMGLTQDWALGWLRRTACPYADLVTR